MPRLFRPAIPVEVKLRVVLRQLGELWPNDVIAQHRRGLGALHRDMLEQLARLLGTTANDLRLDHDPALATRKKRGEGKRTTYTPPANDPDYLIYRTSHAHHIKTQVRGDGAQHPDRVLIKRARKKEKMRVRKAWPKRKMQSANRWPPKGSRPLGGKSCSGERGTR